MGPGHEVVLTFDFRAGGQVITKVQKEGFLLYFGVYVMMGLTAWAGQWGAGGAAVLRWWLLRWVWGHAVGLRGPSGDGATRCVTP